MNEIVYLVLLFFSLILIGVSSIFTIPKIIRYFSKRKNKRALKKFLKGLAFMQIIKKFLNIFNEKENNVENTSRSKQVNLTKVVFIAATAALTLGVLYNHVSKSVQQNESRNFKNNNDIETTGDKQEKKRL